MPSEALFISYGLLTINENAQCPRSVSMQAMQETDFWDPTFFHRVSKWLLTTISFEKCSRAVARCGYAG
jgi:hypothetical protein